MRALLRAVRERRTQATLTAACGAGLILGGLINPGGLAVPIGAALLAVGLALRFALGWTRPPPACPSVETPKTSQVNDSPEEAL